MIKVLPKTNVVSKIQQTAKSLPAITEIPKKVSGQDLLIFRQYIFSKGLALSTTQQEIQNLFKLEGEEFFNASFEFLFQKLGVPEVLKPQVVEMPMNKEFGMAYDFSQNLLIKNTNAPKATKLETYSMIRHELQHMIQNFEIFRHKEIGEKAIDFHAEIISNAQMQNVDYNARNLSMEQLQEMGFPKEALAFYAMLKTPLESNNEEEYLKLLEESKTELMENNKTNYINFRNLIVSEMGYLKEGTRAERRAEKFYNNMINNIYGANDDVHAGKYSYDVRENEAFIAQDVAMRDAEHHLSGRNDCYIANIKEQTEKILENLKENEKVSNELIETTKELQKTSIFNSPKEYADYLFD